MPTEVTRTFTVIRRPIDQLLAVAVGGAAVEIVTTMTISAPDHTICDQLPRRDDLVCIDHSDGTIYGTDPHGRKAFGQHGNLFDILGFSRLSEAFVGRNSLEIHVQGGFPTLATRCLRTALGLGVNETITALRRDRPFTMDRTQVVTMLIEGLKAVHARREQILQGRIAQGGRFALGDIFLALTALTAKAA